MGDAHGRGLGVAWSDVDGDGRPDLYVANDRMPADLFRNQGGGRFRNIGVQSGTAYSAEGLANTSHTLTIQATGQKNAFSFNPWIFVDAFDTY